MAKFDSEEEIDEIVGHIKSDLVQIDATIGELIKEAQGRSGGNLKYHDIANPLTKLLSSKQKSIDQLLKIIEANRQEDEDFTFDIEDAYSKYEEEEIK